MLDSTMTYTYVASHPQGITAIQSYPATELDDQYYVINTPIILMNHLDVQDVKAASLDILNPASEYYVFARQTRRGVAVELRSGIDELLGFLPHDLSNQMSPSAWNKQHCILCYVSPDRETLNIIIEY